MEPGDFLGYPVVEGDVTKFARPSWLPEEGTSGTLFIDEINRAPRNVLQALFQLILDRRIHNYALPDGWDIIAAANPSTGDYVVTDLRDAALTSRFVQLKFEPTQMEWVEFQRKQANGLCDVADFFHSQPGLLDPGEDYSLYSTIKPCRRSASALSRLLKTGLPEDLRSECAMGLIGAEATTAFLGFLGTRERLPTGEEILAGYGPELSKKVKRLMKEEKIEGVATIVRSTTAAILAAEPSALTKEVEERVAAFLMDVPDDLYQAALMDMLKDLRKTAPFIGNNKTLIDRLRRMEPEIAKEVDAEEAA
jgi:hypothetical protein